MSELNQREKIKISTFRVGDHNLHMESGRHRKHETPNEKRNCCKCGSVEVEIIFLFNVYYKMNQELHIS